MKPMQIRPPEAAVQHADLTILKRGALAGITIGLFFLLIGLTGMSAEHPLLFLLLSIGLSSASALVYFVAQQKETTPGIKNNHLFENPLTSRGWIAWPTALFFTLFYVSLYWFPQWIENWVRMVDPVSFLITGKKADRWFLYGVFYTVAVLVMGMRIILVKYRHNRYHIVRTACVMFFQLGFAFLIPNFLRRLNQPDFYFSYFWPLKYEYLFPGSVEGLLKHPGGLGFFMVFWGAMMTFVAIPVLTYFFGKRWYCSWVCGCGGLAETLGDPFRHLSDKSLKAWKIERWMVHSVLLLIVITTGLLWYNSISDGGILRGFSSKLAKGYGFFIGAIFSGVIGVGFYPLMGQRVWCRFGCPLAATLGIIQKFFSRFRISTNGGQCMSCGNCSTYCEMGIDVRWYAQRGQNIIRASCVGCGVCAAVCPRGVLKLENGPHEGRYNLKSS